MLSHKFESGDGLKVGILGRTLYGFTEIFEEFGSYEAMGKGLGVGTNVGSGLLSGGVRIFLVAESEWPRIIGEVGPVLGLPYIALRIAIAWYLLRRSLASIRKGESLAMLLFGASGLSVLTGPFGAAQSLAFTVFTAGIALAATKRWDENSTEEFYAMLEAAPAQKKLPRGRSAYAERLHSGENP